MDQTLAMFLLVFICAGMPMLAVFFIMLMDSRGSKKTKFLYIDSPNHCRMINQIVKEGEVKVGKKNYILGDIKPKLIRSGIFFKVFKPLYVLRWNNPHPYTFDDENREIKLTSESTKLLSRNTTLETLLKGGGSGGAWLWIIIGLAIGFMLGYIILSTGIIPMPVAPTPVPTPTIG